MKHLAWILLLALITGCASNDHPFIDRDSRNFAAMPAPPRAAPPQIPAAAPAPTQPPRATNEGYIPRFESGSSPGTYYFRGPASGSSPPAIMMPPAAAYAPEAMRPAPAKVERRKVTATVPVTVAVPVAVPVAVDANQADEAMKTWPFLGQLKKADIAFNTPKQMELGTEADLQLIIDPTKTAEEIKQAITAEGAKIGATVHVSKVVVAKLLAPDFEVIELVNRGKQAIDFNGPTEWQWVITPKKEGSHKIHLTIHAVVEVGSDKAERFIKSFEHEITVIVTPANRVKGLIEKHWQWGFSSLLVPFGIWLWKRRKEKQA